LFLLLPEPELLSELLDLSVSVLDELLELSFELEVVVEPEPVLLLLSDDLSLVGVLV
jgi:hypothetical protein